MSSLESLKKIGMQLLDEELQKNKGTESRRLTEALEQYKKERWYNKLLNLEGEFEDVGNMKLPNGANERHVGGLVRLFEKFMENMESGDVPPNIETIVRDLSSAVLDVKESLKRLSDAEDEQAKRSRKLDEDVNKLSSQLAKLT